MTAVNPNRATALVLALLAVIAAVVAQVGRGPSPLPAATPDARFSAARAVATLREILPDDLPHPVGSAAHDAVRNRIGDTLRTLGYSVSYQQTLACNAYATCAPVVNIMARLAGDARADTLAVIAHYDSVAAGPGVSDDGIAVATILETARAVRGEHFRNSVLFLITDGEEGGLLGAEAFIADPALMRGVTAAINIDNRGTSGRSYLFETSANNRWLVRAVGRALPHPAASSLFPAIYELLPNDTDLSVFKRSGMAGINFACNSGVAFYHTPLDNLRHVTPSTVQDHGDHVLAMTRALANSDLRQTSDDNAVFFDLFSLAVVWWPQGWTRWMAMGALLLLLIAAAMRMREGGVSPGGITAGVISFFFSAVAAALAGGVAAWVTSLRTAGETWVAQPGPSIAAMWLIGIAVAIVCARSMYARAGFDGLFIGHGLCWATIGIGIATVLPGGSYLFVVPAIAFALCMTLRVTAHLGAAWMVMLTAAIAAILWFPVVLNLYDALGRLTLGVIAAVIAIISTAFTPVAAEAGWMRRSAVTAFAVTAAACIVMQLMIPAVTANWPRRLNVRYVLDDQSSRWEVDALTPALRSQMQFTKTDRATAPWTGASPNTYSAQAPHLPYAFPDVRIVSDEHIAGRKISLEVRSARGANAIALIFRAPSLSALRVDGITPPQRPAKFLRRLAPGWHAVNVIGAQQALVDITLRTDERIEAIVADRSGVLPPEAAPLVRARDASLAVRSGEGDVVIVRHRLSL